MNLTIDNFIQLTSQGISVMDYADICQTLLARYKAIYGQEIDLDPRSADGRFIYDVATIINNACLVISQMYNNMSPSNATGYFLDILSSLTNVTRESATASKATVEFTNPTSSDITITDSTSIYMKDDSGDIWIPENIEIPIVIPKLSSIKITYTSQVLGQTKTSSLAFSTLTDKLSNIITSIESFDIGRDEESDSSLRYRRASDSTYGITVLEGLQGKLNKLWGIDDCYIQSYAGNTGETPYCYIDNKEISMPKHSISILLRYNKVNNPVKSKIYEIIKSNITPGIMTNGTTQYNELKNTILSKYSWYIVNRSIPTIIIHLSNLYNFGGNDTAYKIAEAMVDYLNNLKINQQYSSASLIQVAQSADPKYMSRSTYTVTAVDGLFDDTNQLNRGCYFDYGSRRDIDYTVSLKNNNAYIEIKAI